MDQMKRAMEEMKDSMRRENHMDDLVHRIDSPFIASITSHPLPFKFKMSTLVFVYHQLASSMGMYNKKVSKC